MAPKTLAHLLLRDVVSSSVDSVNGAVQDVNGVRHTVSSWDNCMSESYCKYPVIIGIIVAVLIAVSIAWCVIRCCCCGLECCCSCFSCFNSCCPSPRGRKRAHSNQGMSRLNSNHQYGPPPIMYSQPGFLGAQTATFDSTSARKTKNGGLHEDALPSMPSWDTATEKRVQDDSLDTEMDTLHAPGSNPTQGQQAQGLLNPTNPRPSYGAYPSSPSPGPVGEAASYFNPQQPPRAYDPATSPDPTSRGGYPAPPDRYVSPLPFGTRASPAPYEPRRVSPAPYEQQARVSPAPYEQQARVSPLPYESRGYTSSPAPTPYAASPYSAPYQPSGYQAGYPNGGGYQPMGTQVGAGQGQVGQRQGYRQVSDGWHPSQQQHHQRF